MQQLPTLLAQQLPTLLAEQLPTMSAQQLPTLLAQTLRYNIQQHATECANGRNIWHPTMLGVVGQQCRVRLHGALHEMVLELEKHLGYLVKF